MQNSKIKRVGIRIYHFFTKTRLRKILSSVLAILILLTSIRYLIFTPKDVEAAWFDDGWAYRKRVDFGNTGAADSNKKVKIDLDTATLISQGKMQSSGGDIRVTDSNGLLLSHHILPSGNSVKIDDAGDPGAQDGENRQIVRTSTGTLYAAINDGGSCEIWMSGNGGEDWSEQDSSNNPSCFSGRSMSVAVDSTDLIHVAYTLDPDTVNYVSFSTSTNTFGTPEEIDTDAFVDEIKVDIAVDSSNIPHVLYASHVALDTDSTIYYNNRIGGAWNATAVTLESFLNQAGNAGVFMGSITISEDNIPEIVYENTIDSDLTAALGNANDATSFTLKDVDTSTNDNSGGSIAVDQSGNTWIGYVDENGATDFVTLVKHNDADAWTTWQTPVTNSNAGSEPSIAIDGTDVYVFYREENADIAYDKYTGSWAGEVILQTGTFQDVKTRWAYYSNLSLTAYGIDYLYSDGTDIYWNRLVFGPINNSSTDIWVLVPTINSGTNSLYVYYGNPSAVGINSSSQFTQAIFTPTSGPTVASEEKGPGPVLLLKMDEGFGSATSDSTTSDTDGSISGSTWQAEDLCASGKCLKFDGSDDEITVTNANSIDFDTGLVSGVTFSGWVRVNSDGEGDVGRIVDKGTNTYLRVTNEGADGLADLEGKLDLASGGSDATATVTNGIILNRWHHVVMGYSDDGDDEISVYIDGQLRATSTDGSGAPASTDGNNLILGGDSSTTGNYHGFIDDFKVYNYERTATQVKGDFAGLGSSESVAQAFIPNQKFTSDGLVGYWKADETSGNMADSSGNSTTLTDTNTVTFSTGKFANGGDYESTASEYQFAADNAPLSVTGNLTIAAWIKPESVTASTLFDIAGKFDDANESYQLAQFGDEIRFYIDSASNYATTDAANLATGTFYHVVGVYDSASAAVKLYVNGVLSASTVTGTIPSSIGNDAGAFHIGAEDSTAGGDAAGNFYDGFIDEIRVYNRVLTASEIERLNNWAPGPVGYWKTDENSGTTAQDSSTNDNTLTLSSASWTPGKFGPGWDGTGAIWLSRADDADFDFTSGENFTVSLWYKSDSATNPGANEYLLDKEAGTGYGLYLTTGGLVTFGIDSDGSWTPADTAASSADVYDGAWHHVSAIKTGTSKIEIFVDGILVGSDSSIAANGDLTNADSLTVGDQNATNDGDEFFGDIDDVKIYRYIRTPNQIVEDLNAGHPLGGSPISSPILYWALDEQTGTTAYNRNPNYPSLTGTVATINEWKYAGATADGSAGCKVNSCIKIPGGADEITGGDVTFLDGSSTMTVSYWVNPQSITIRDTTVTKSDASGTNNTFVIRTDDTNADEMKVYIGDGVDFSDFFLTSDLDLTAANTFANWTHMAVVYNGSLANSERVKVYKNGRLVSGSVSGTLNATLVNSAANLTMGDSDIGGVDALVGYYDEVKIYTVALSQSEVLVDMNAGSAAALGGTLGTQSNEGLPTTPFEHIYTFDENTGTTVKDSGLGATTSQRNGTFTLGPTFALGKYGSGVLFDGVDSYLDVGAVELYDETATTTITAWVNPTSFAANNIIVCASTGEGTCFYTDTSGALVYCANVGCTTTASSTSSAVTLNVWQYVALLFNGSGVCTFYINGINVTSDSTCGETSSTYTTQIGGTTGTGTGVPLSFSGIIDQLKINDKNVISVTEMHFDYNRGAPQLWYKFDECTGATTNNSAPAASGGDSGNDGTITPGANTHTSTGTCNSGSASEMWDDGQTGKRNYSLDFDGEDDYVDMDDVSLLDFVDAQNFTISGWFNRETFTTDDTIVAKKNTQTSSSAGFIVWIDDSTDDLRLVVSDGDSTNLHTVDSTSTFTSTGWNHFVIVYDDSSSSASKIYINGNDDSATNTTTGTFGLIGNLSNSVDFRIGGESDTATDAPFAGELDDIRVYHYVPTASQVKRIFNDVVFFGPAEGHP